MKPLLLRLTNGWYPNNNPRSEKGYAYRPPINFLPVFIALLLVATAWTLFFGYEPNALTIEDIEATLTPEQLRAYRASQAAVDEKFDDCIQYILYAYKDGKYLCLSCPSGIPFVTLEAGDIWYIGHTCQKGEARHTLSFQIKNGVWLFANYRGSKQECNTVELKLIRGYKYLPESQKPEAKLILPPYNQTDKY